MYYRHWPSRISTLCTLALSCFYVMYYSHWPMLLRLQKLLPLVLLKALFFLLFSSHSTQTTVLVLTLLLLWSTQMILPLKICLILMLYTLMQLKSFPRGVKTTILVLMLWKQRKCWLILERTRPLYNFYLFIDGVKVERVNEYKYLGTALDDNLSFTINTDLIKKKCQSRKLRSFQMDVKVLQSFYRCFIVSRLSFSLVCWYGRLGVKSKNVLNRVVNVCSKVVGERQVSVNELFER